MAENLIAIEVPIMKLDFERFEFLSNMASSLVIHLPSILQKKWQG